VADTSLRPSQALPVGTVTFLYTDIEGSTKRWERAPGAMKAAVERHDALLREAIERNGGVVFRTMGDAFCASFMMASDALAAALGAQHVLQAESWDPEIAPIMVRMALHTGLGEVRDGDYVGTPLNRIARLLATGYGGQTLLSQAAYELLREALPTGVIVRDLGEHRLKDLQNTERIFQVVTPDLPADFPPIKTLDYRPNNLPAQPSAFVGREKEVADVRELLVRDNVRLVTLLGPGGTGKTRLALQVGVEMLEGFMDGVFFVSLSSISDPGLVASQVAQAIGVREVGGLPLIESLKDYLRDKRLLLLLDNFEQVVEAAPLVAELLAVAPQVKVLVTSQQVLHLRGEQEYPVPPLGLPDMSALPGVEALSQYEAVALFVQRAQLANPAFELTAENAAAVAEICNRLDGLPLALELAAARSRLLSPDAMLDRLITWTPSSSGPLRLLTGGARDLPERQQTLRGAIEWSYDLLESGEKQLFRRLAAFAGGCTLEAAEAVCGGGQSGIGNGESDNSTPAPLDIDVFDGIESLASKSLLRQESGASREPRFRMLQTIREYAMERLELSGEAEMIRRAHALYFLQAAEDAEPKLVGPEQEGWMDRLDNEHDNIRAALDWCVSAVGETATGCAEIGLRMAGALLWFWQTRGHLSEGRARLATLLNRPGAQARTLARSKALVVAGRLAFLQGDYEAARAMYQENVQLVRELGDKRGTGHALIALASADTASGDYASAHALYQEGLAIERELGDKWYAAMALVGLGEAMIGEENYDEAVPRLDESLALFQQVGNSTGAAFTTSLLGLVAFHAGDVARARSLQSDSLSTRSRLENKQGVAVCLVGLAEIALTEGNATRAVSMLGAAEALLGSVGARIGVSDQARYERILAATREHISAAEWEAAWERGRKMNMTDATSFAQSTE
jgi:predicted ATPase/class 3 adenylate cyclase